ncbi:hypothetical protein MTO96_026517 [Rhipicephalus appendiculatus]
MMTVDWKRLDKKLWVQSLITKPFKNTQCISRAYRGEQNKVRFRAIGGSYAQTWHVKREFQNGWHNKDKIGFKQGPQPHVYQILDTDYETFVVEHFCNHWRGDVVSIMYHKPVKQIPESVIKRANAAMIKSGLDATKMSSTDCMLSGKGHFFERSGAPMDKRVATKPKRAKPPGKQSPQEATPDALPSSRHGDRPDVMVVSTKGAAANARQKWLELLESSKRSKPTQEPLAETTESSPRERSGRAMVTSGNGGDTSAPLSPPKKAAFRRDKPRPLLPHPFQQRHTVAYRARRRARGTVPVQAPLSGTSVGAQSPQSFTPEDTRPLSPELTGSPPKISVLVAATNGSPKTQPYDGFPGVPTYIGAPGVIVFTPRVSPTGAGTPLPSPEAVLDRCRQKTAAESSHPIEDTGVEESALIIKRRRPTLLQAWALCVVAAATLNLPDHVVGETMHLANA